MSTMRERCAKTKWKKLTLDLHYMVQVALFGFFPLKWHRSDLQHERVIVRSDSGLLSK